MMDDEEKDGRVVRKFVMEGEFERSSKVDGNWLVGRCASSATATAAASWLPAAARGFSLQPWTPLSLSAVSGWEISTDVLRHCILMASEEGPSQMDGGDTTDDDLPQCKIKRNYACNLCSFFSQNPRSFLYHMRDVHFDKIKIYECSKCLYASKHSQKLQRHINMIHVSGRFSRKKETQKKSGKATATTSAMTEPPSSPTASPEEPKIKCPLCSFTSRSPAIISRHERVVHLKKRFLRCSKCSYVTHVKARFTKHVKYHSMPMIKCDLCDFRTPYKWNLDRHYKNHCGTGAFQCSKCNFRADIKQSLTVHEMNHHVPPVGAGAAILLRKRNKVGASETTAFESDNIDQDEMELLRLERDEEDNDERPGNVAINKPEEESDDEEPDLNADPPVGKLETALSKPLKSEMGAFVHPDAKHKSIKCKFCNYRGTFADEVTRHEKRIHGTRDKRPPPNLIPIQGKSSSPILRIPDIRSTKRHHEEPVLSVNEEEFNEMCKNSSLTSSLKEFVSLIGDEDALKSIPDPRTDADDIDADADANGDGDEQKTQTDQLKLKNAPFFDRIKERLSSDDGVPVVCEVCGEESRTTIEAVAHRKTHDIKDDRVLSGAELSSTRCQHCRHRCKTSADLVLHLKTCKAFGAAYASPLPDEEPDANRVFIWNELPRDDQIIAHSIDDDIDAELVEDPPAELLEPEMHMSTAHGAHGAHPVGTERTAAPDPRALTLKKVFKCPHCSFWASTASRFHVHIVGHLNKKPFECSLCYYRSNWRWDITKHIRLKSARDPNHAHATVNMTDETGRRNYSKYNKFLTMMKVQEPLADSSGTGRRTRACDATQGTVQDGDLLQPLSDQPRAVVHPVSSALRELPSIQPTHLSSICKRTLWKCKKCLYRNQDKEKVLSHVKTHYTKHSLLVDDVEDEIDIGQPDQLMARSLYKCGHCGQISNWRQGIVRHCRLRHNNVVKILPCSDKEAAVVVDESSGDLASNSSADEGLEGQPTSSNPFACDVCPFIAESAGDLTAHKLNHIDRPGSIFKCTYCPFFVPSKIAVLEHMEIHGVERNEGNKQKHDSIANDSDEEIEEVKRFRCRHCPYVSNSKTQYLHHKQFHRPRQAPFKCMFCSYNVSRRHLLHQHLKVHHMLREEDVPDIPLVWVLRSGTYSKMFKCRWCPHVNLRRSNIQDHEKMHIDPCKLQCPDCSYTCNNPGVLSSHVKVHSGYFGEIRSLVDPTQPDDEQIKTLQTERTAEPEITIQVDEVEPDTPESSYYQTIDEVTREAVSNMMSFCSKCPARFFFDKELRIHCKFHLIRLPFKCPYCSYTARQRPHLLAHYKVHSMEYQERTARLVDNYVISEDNPRPKTGVIAPASDLILGPVWSVIAEDFVPPKTDRRPQAKHSCTRCPAKFFKPVALQYHMTLHGSKHQHRCRHCDYAVKTYGNLIKHQLIHEQAEAELTSPDRKTDPQFGALMHGSPDFIYPTYLKNGKIREKRYKCHKCPSAFEKRDQYRIHLSLHGAKQKYKCEKCDYSVKYYANYIQHMKKHKNNEDAQQAKEQELDQELELEQEQEQEQEQEPMAQPPPAPEQEELSSGERQEKRRKLAKDDERKVFQCDLCPYVNMRRDCLENHERRHYLLSGVKYGFDCRHCDYTTTQANFLREHTRVHFKVMPPPEAYLLVENLTILYDDDALGGSGWLFKDCGGGRFEPEMAQPEDNDDVADVVLFDPVRWEPIDDDEPVPAEGEPKVEQKQEQEQELEQEQDKEIEDEVQIEFETKVEFKEELKEEDQPMHEEIAPPASPAPPLPPPPPKKRPREKNWRCGLCPHAFNKRDQYMRHVALHGSRQRYSCDICDYSVKFYTNYVQHMRMHQAHDPDRVIEIKPCVPGVAALEPISFDIDDVEAVDESDSSDVSSSSQNILPAHFVEMSMVEPEMDGSM